MTRGFPILFVAGPEDIPLIVSGINEVTCRGGRTIAIGQGDSRLEAKASDLIVTPAGWPPVAAPR